MCKCKTISYPSARASFLFYSQLRYQARNRYQRTNLTVGSCPRSFWGLWQNFWMDSVNPMKHQPLRTPWSKQKTPGWQKVIGHLLISISIQENLLCKKQCRTTFLAEFSLVIYSGFIYDSEISGGLARYTEKSGQKSQRLKKGMCQRF